MTSPLRDRFVDPMFGTFSLGLAQRHYALGALWCGRPVQLVLEIPAADDDRDLTQPLAHARAFFMRADDWQAHFAESLPAGQEPVSLNFDALAKVTARFRDGEWNISVLSASLRDAPFD
jgi:hypothetical protein